MHRLLHQSPLLLAGLLTLAVVGTALGSETDAVDQRNPVAVLPTLEQITAAAMKNNPEIRLAEARLQQARLSVVQKITEFRRQWQQQAARLRSAEEELRQLQRTAKETAQHRSLVSAAKERVAVLRQDLSEKRTVLSLLLGARPAPARKKPDATRQKLIKERMLPSAKQALQLTMKEHRSGHSSASDVYRWSKRVMEAKRSLARTKEKRIEAIETHQEFIQQLAKVADARFRTGNAPQSEVVAVQYYLAEAELWLTDAKEK